MKPTLSLTLSFLLFAFISKFPLAFSNLNPVIGQFGNPVLQAGKYYILPAFFGPTGGGVGLEKTGDLKCPVTVLQAHSEVDNGIPVKFSMLGRSSDNFILTDIPLKIEFTENPYQCAESSKWLVFIDNDIKKACVGIGGPENYPGKKILNGTFQIQNYQQQSFLKTYKLVFCLSGSPTTCMDIGRYDNEEGGNRLILNQHKAFEVVFRQVRSLNVTYNNNNNNNNWLI